MRRQHRRGRKIGGFEGLHVFSFVCLTSNPPKLGGAGAGLVGPGH